MQKQRKPLNKSSTKFARKHFPRIVLDRPIIIISAFLLILISLTISILNASGLIGQPKIAFVRSQELVYGYLGMQEAHNKYTEKMQQWQANKQTLESEYQTVLTKYQEEAPKLSEDEKAQRENYLKKLQANIENYRHSINELTKEEDANMTQAVLNQINSFIEDYGKRHGYDIILGTTLSGNILYGDQALDITEHVLDALNRAYAGEEADR